jgi:hypothetical protein
MWSRPLRLMWAWTLRQARELEVVEQTAGERADRNSGPNDIVGGDVSPHVSRGISSRLASTLAIAALAAVSGLTAGSSVSHADACVAGPVSILTKKDTRLTSPLRLTIYATCDDTYDATACGYLYVAGHRTGRLSALTLTNVQSARTIKTIEIPAKVLAATRAYARRHHQHRVVLKFVVRATSHTTGKPEPHAFAMHNELRI